MRSVAAIALVLLVGCAGESSSYEPSGGGSGASPRCSADDIRATLILINAGEADERAILVGSTRCGLTPSDLNLRELQGPRERVGL